MIEQIMQRNPATTMAKKKLKAMQRRAVVPGDETHLKIVSRE